MESKMLVKSLQEYRVELVQQASEDIVELFDQYVLDDKKISAVKLLKKYNIIKLHSST